MNKACCVHFEPTPSGGCLHRKGAGLCSKAIAPVCRQFIGERVPLTDAPKLCTGTAELAALAQKVTESTRVAIDVRTVHVDGLGDCGRVCSFGFDDGTVCIVDLVEDDCEDIFAAMCKTRLVGIGLKESLLGIAERLPSETRDLLDLGIVSRIVEAGQERVRPELGCLLFEYLGIERVFTASSLHWTGLLTRIHLIAAGAQVADVLCLADTMLEDVKLQRFETVVDLELKAIPATIEMEVRGLPVNELRWFRKSAELEHAANKARRAQRQAELEEDDVGAGLYKAEVRSLENALTGFVQTVSAALKCSNEPRVSGQLNQCGTVTGRFTCEGVPLLSMPKRHGLRACIEAPKWSKLVIADFSCFELRVLAALANDEAMLALFCRGEDVHKLIASSLLDKPVDEVTESERQRIKAVSFGTVFGLTSAGLVALARNEYGVELSPDKAEEYQARFFSRFMGIADWRKAVVLERAPTSTTRLGRMRRWEPGNDGDGARLAFPVQGSAADIMKSCVVELYLPLKAMGAAILLVVHDELIVEAPTETAEQVLRLLEKDMPAIASRLFPEVPFVVNARCCKTLGAHQ